MVKLIDSYLQYLATNPGKVDSIIVWTFSTFIIWIIMFMYREKIIKGMSGENGLFESPEVVGYILCWVFPPIINYSAFFNVELPNWVWWFLASGIAYTLGGRWLFEWVLALRAGSTRVETTTTTVTDPPKVKTETVEVVKQEIIKPE